MRQVGTLPGRDDASRFTAFLITEGISCKAEEEDDGTWAVWVHDESGVERAKGEFDKFVDDPGNSRYLNLETKAGEIVREEQERRTSARRNMVDVRTKWARPTSAARTPLTMTLIVLSVVVFFMTPRTTGRSSLGSRIENHLLFVDRLSYVQSNYDPLANIKQGQLWRLVTPVFIHGDPLHLIFNMFMLFQLGRLLEVRHGSARLALMVLLIAVVSNTAQALTPGPLQEVMGGALFGGMSGVVFGLFGYAWILSSRNPAGAGFMLPPSSVFIMLGFMFLCMTPAISNIANMAHVVGLLTGMLLALAKSMS